MCVHGKHVYCCNKCSSNLRTTTKVVFCDEDTPVTITVDWRCCEKCNKHSPSDMKKARRVVADRYELEPCHQVETTCRAEMKGKVLTKVGGSGQKEAEVNVQDGDEDDFVLIDSSEGDGQEYVFV